MAKKKFYLRPDTRNLIYTRLDRVKLLEFLGCTSIKVSGREIRSTCPIHGGDGINNFILYNDTNWQCKSSGCHSNEKQDVFSLVMKSKNYKFMESLKLVAGFASVNVDLDDDSFNATEEVIKATSWSNSVNKKEYGTSEIKEVDKSLVRKFMLNRNSYLSKRKFPEWVLNDFEVGFTSDWKLLSRLNLDAEERVTFPTSFKNKYISIQGRCIKGRGDKYKFPNDPWPRDIKYDTFSNFPKDKYLYNFDRALEYASFIGNLILVEGVTDVMRCHQYGIRNVVSGWGDSLSKNQRKLLLESGVTEVIIMYDNDEPAKKATETVIECLENLFDIYVAIVPKKEDENKNDPENCSSLEIYHALSKKRRRLHPKKLF